MWSDSEIVALLIEVGIIALVLFVWLLAAYRRP
jgi:hypothetical protein